jgi:hypothetical protein
MDAAEALDRGRLRSLVGLCLARVGPRASTAVMGTYLTLLASSRTSSALGITFATSAHRVASWAVYPMAGRASDQSRTLIGRRAPYMGGALLLMAASTWLLPSTHGYWTLVAAVFLARGAAVIFNVANVAVVPEAFGRSRWIRALVVTAVLGGVAGLSIRASVITRWKTSDPSTWGGSFRLAAIFIAAAGVATLLLVREAPGARRPRRPSGHLPSHLRTVLSVPNARPLLAALCLGAAAGGASGKLTPVFYSKVLHAGGSTQTSAGIVAGVLGAAVAIPVVLLLVRHVGRKQLAISMPIGAAALTAAQMGVNSLWQSLALGILSGALLVTWVIATLLLIVQMAPREGGMAERYGIMVAPFSLCSLIAAFAAAAAVDLAGTYRIMWLFPAGFLAVGGLSQLWLQVPKGYERVDLGVITRRLTGGLRTQLQVNGAPLLGGELSREDVDGAAVFDLARHYLGDPYAENPSPEPV